MGERLPPSQPTNADAEGAEDKVDLVEALEDPPEGEAHGGEEDETQGQGQHHEAHAHVDEN